MERLDIIRSNVTISHNDSNAIIVVREDKALVCHQPRQRKRGRNAFQPRCLAHTQRGTPNSFQPRRVSLGRFNRFPRHGGSGLKQSHYTEESESTSLVPTVHAIQNVPPYSIQ